MSSNSENKISEKFLDEWLTEHNFPTSVPLEMKVMAYLGYLSLETDRLQKLSPKKARGAPKKEITKDMLRASKFLSAKEGLIKREHKNPTKKVVIEYLIQISNILYEHNAISKEDRDLFTSTSMKSIQNTISKGLKELEKFSK